MNVMQLRRLDEKERVLRPSGVSNIPHLVAKPSHRAPRHVAIANSTDQQVCKVKTRPQSNQLDQPSAREGSRAAPRHRLEPGTEEMLVLSRLRGHNRLEGVKPRQLLLITKR